MTRVNSGGERHSTTDEETDNAYVLLARGEIDAEDRRLVSKFIKRLGLAGEFMPENEYEDRVKKLSITFNVDPNIDPNSAEPETTNPYSILNISGPEHFLVREHFDDFKLRRSDLKMRMGLPFGFLLVGPKGRYEKRRQHALDLSPPEPIIAVPREEVGFEPYTGKIDPYSRLARFSADYAVQAGSLVEYTKPLETASHIKKYELALLLISRQLQTQFA